MHLFFITRGIKQQRDLFLLFMQSQMFPWVRTNLKTGKEEIERVQGALRPIELWEYVFPEEHLDEVCTMLGKSDNAGSYWGTGSAKYGLPLLRKALDVKKLPDIKSVPTSRYIPHEGLGIEVIGIKKDKREKSVKFGYEQEML